MNRLEKPCELGAQNFKLVKTFEKYNVSSTKMIDLAKQLYVRICLNS